MNNRIVYGMLGGVLVLLIAAAVLLNGGNSGSGASEALCPELGEHINDVTSVVVESRKETLAYDRDADGNWTARDHGGYAANGEKIGTLLIALRDAELIEPKSKKPENWKKLGVEDPGEGAASARIEVRGPDDAVYADVIVGNRRTQGSAEAAHYVRERGGDTPWVASGDLRVPQSLREWVDTQILDVAATRVASVRIEHPGGDSYLMQKSEEERAQLVPTELPEGKELQSEYVTSRFGSALARLSFDGVQRAESTEFPADDAVVTRIWTRHGLLVTVETVEVGGEEGDGGEVELLARVRAEYDPLAPVIRAEPEGPVIDDEGGGDLLDEGPEPPTEPEGPTPEELQAEAAEINARTEPWIYVLPSFKAASFRTELDELLKDVDPPPAETPEDGDELVPDPPPDDESASDPPPEGDGEPSAGTADDGDSPPPTGDAPTEEAPEGAGQEALDEAQTEGTDDDGPAPGGNL